jgi:uracil-DNA glycosylase family 4
LTAGASRFDILQAAARSCRRCEVAGHIDRAAPVFSGRLTDRVLVVGQAPGLLSVERDMPFGGPAGRSLDDWFDRAGFSQGYFRQRCYLSSLTRCFPGKVAGGSGDRPPSRAEMTLCRGFLDEEIGLLRPALVLLVGRLAINELLGAVASRSSLTEIIGKDFMVNGVRYLPLPHSSGVSRWLNVSANRDLLNSAVDRLGQLRVQLDLDTPA